MFTTPLSFDAPIADYRSHAIALLAGHRAGEAAALRCFHEHHPCFRDAEVLWKPREISPDEIAASSLGIADAELTVARVHGFRDWPALEAHVTASLDPDSPVHRFERAVEAVIDGDLPELDALLRSDPALARATSRRVTCFDPPEHRATLLHYLGANGVEAHRQRSPTNAVAIARRLFEAGAEADALAFCYGGACTTLSLLVSSTPPAEAGVQVPLLHAMIDGGASVEGTGLGRSVSPLQTALVFGFPLAARALVERGARVESLLLEAGLGRLEAVRARLARENTSAPDRHAAFALAAQLGHAAVVAVLLDAGEDPDRYNPEGFHAHATPLHQAALAGHLDVVRTLVERGARRDLRDKLWNGTPRGWAEHGGQNEVAAFLASC
jgi:hypothetical protein